MVYVIGPTGATGITGPSGPTGPTGATGPDNGSFAVVQVDPATYANNDLLNITSSAQGDSDISPAMDGTSVSLAVGAVYQISYTVRSTAPVNGYIEITPVVNGTDMTAYAVRAHAIATDTTVTSSNSFLLPVTTATTLQFRYTSDNTAATAATGSVSIVRASTI